MRHSLTWHGWMSLCSCAPLVCCSPMVHLPYSCSLALEFACSCRSLAMLVGAWGLLHSLAYPGLSFMSPPYTWASPRKLYPRLLLTPGSKRPRCCYGQAPMLSVKKSWWLCGYDSAQAPAVVTSGHHRGFLAVAWFLSPVPGCISRVRQYHH